MTGHAFAPNPEHPKECRYCGRREGAHVPASLERLTIGQAITLAKAQARTGRRPR